MTDLFNLFSLEFLAALEHLSEVMDVIYVGQLSSAWVIHGHALSQFPQIWRVFTLFLIWPSFVQKKVSNKMTLKYKELTKSPIPKLGSEVYIYPQLHWFYLIRCMVSFWSGNNLLKGDFKRILPKGYFKNTKTYQNIWGQQVVRPFSFNLLNLEEFNQIDSLSTP